MAQHYVVLDDAEYDLLTVRRKTQQDQRVIATDQMTDEQWAKAIIIHLTGQPDDPTPMLMKMIADMRGDKSRKE